MSSRSFFIPGSSAHDLAIALCTRCNIDPSHVHSITMTLQADDVTPILLAFGYIVDFDLKTTFENTPPWEEKT